MRKNESGNNQDTPSGLYATVPKTPGTGSVLNLALQPSLQAQYKDKEQEDQAQTFWRDRLFELGLILSLVLYYLVGNPNLKGDPLFFLNTLNPLYSLPFLLLFAVFCWYRLPFAVALLPLTLPFYLLPKTVMLAGGHPLNFSIAEIALVVCMSVALVQLAAKRRDWPYALTWAQLRQRLGPFLLPMLVFGVMAALSVVIAAQRDHALRAFRLEVFEPLIYVLLALICLRTRQDLVRLLAALLGSGLLVALLGIVQYAFFKNTLVVEDSLADRVHGVYGSANSIGLLFDYTLPLALSLLFARVSWGKRLIGLLVCIPMVLVLYLSQSRGAWAAIAVSLLFVIGFAIRNRKILIVSAVVLMIALSTVLFVYGSGISKYVIDGHTSQQGTSTIQKRFYLWQTASNMIHDHPWLGVGMDNWLCYYSRNTVCDVKDLTHYWIKQVPGTNPAQATGLGDEPELSHPHNIFLHVWVSMGIFGLLSFLAVLVLFYWLFIRILVYLHGPDVKDGGRAEQLRWITVGIGAAMLAALVQGQGDSAFLEQDLAFCFWALVAALLLVRILAQTPWRKQISKA